MNYPNQYSEYIWFYLSYKTNLDTMVADFTNRFFQNNNLFFDFIMNKLANDNEEGIDWENRKIIFFSFLAEADQTTVNNLFYSVWEE